MVEVNVFFILDVLYLGYIPVKIYNIYIYTSNFCIYLEYTPVLVVTGTIFRYTPVLLVVIPEKLLKFTGIYVKNQSYSSIKIL